MSEPVFQASLGTVNSNSGRVGKTWNDGSLDAGQVTVMHHKRATADTEVLNGPNEIKSREEKEGMNSPIICSRYAGYDEEFERPYGEFLPLQEKDRPVIVYAKNQKAMPLIVGVLHHTDDKVGETNLHDILPVDYPIDPVDKREALRQIWVHRTQDGFTIEGENGEFELSTHSKSFMRSCRTNQDEETFDYEDLVLKDKQSIEDGDPKTIYLPEMYSEPLKYMLVFRDKYKDEDTNHLRWCIDASQLTFKMNQQDNQAEKSTNFLLDADGSVCFRRQLDSEFTGLGEKYTQADMDSEGNATLQYRASDEDKTNFVKVHETEMILRRQLDSKELDEGERYTYLMIDEDADVTIQQRASEDDVTSYVTVHEKDIVIRRQLDDKELGGGEKYTYAQIKENGDFEAMNHTGSTPALLRMENGRITLEVGASSIVMTKDHITINSPRVDIN